ncbi:hypothetical protein CC78DRAFT_567934 [Lojkania enalia]|uniref:Zn(2)-C6 fungal-type domain-containing protein n=1 Tax=Lojkania enalia TaxID=147567 RepID=A0A9P4KB01_9PLEO|nr:hypothetical protein CC78DRAFT_567934 [Didymosphaeria enalia]
MGSQLPHLQLSDTDGAGPMKRRRPALACVECRRRKVKCDRKKPCSPCTRIKSLTCTYRPNHRDNDRGTRSHTSVSTSQDGLVHTSPQTSAQSIDFDSLLIQNLDPSISDAYGFALESSRLNPSAIEDNSHFISTIKALAAKVRELEESLSIVSDRDSSGSRALPIRPVPSPGPGRFIKSKFFGESHWVNAIEPYEALGGASIVTNPNTKRTEINKSSELYALAVECKRMARTIKAARYSSPEFPTEVQSSLPSKNVCDELVRAYFRTFEGIYRVLHVPTFWNEYERYWKDTSTTSTSVLMKILLVCAIGTAFYTGDRKGPLRNSCSKWIEAAESWLSGPHKKSRLNTTGIQVHILLLLARQVCSMDGDLIWISAGALLRSAMHIGLHRDPSHFGKLSCFHIEIRRRLWATIMEITVQSSLDIGISPMISPRDFDTLPPSNINDNDINERMTTPFRPRAPDEFTQTSVQIAFCKTLSLRLEIARRINDLHSSLSYDETLRLTSELTTACRSDAHLFQSFLLSTPSPTPFHVKMLDVLVRRFILNLHRPFFVKAKASPKYYYSRKLCLDTSLTITQPLPFSREGIAEPDDDWTLLGHRCVGFWKSIWLYSITTIYLELLLQIDEQKQEVGAFPLLPVRKHRSVDETLPSDPASHSSHSIPGPSTPHLQRALPLQFDQLRAVIDSARASTEARLRNGETNAKGIVFMACALARIDALASGANPDMAVLVAAKKSVALSADLMRTAYREENGVDINLTLHPPLSDEDHMGADTRPRHMESWDGSAGEGFRGLMEDMDWENLMQDESVDFGFGFLEGSPENWFLDVQSNS